MLDSYVKFEFQPWPKIKRDNLSMYVTEKLDGTNACIRIVDMHELKEGHKYLTSVVDNYGIIAQSRKRFIIPGDDNMGFAKWVSDNATELVKLGHGNHFGEWVGPGIQKNPHELEQKEFYLFNHYRWHKVEEARKEGHSNAQFPLCAKVVPFLGSHEYKSEYIEEIMLELQQCGSKIGGQAEGIVIYIPEADHYQKVTFENSEGKWKNA